MRASVSDGPPAGYGTTIVIGRDGYVSALAGAMHAASRASAIEKRLFMRHLPMTGSWPLPKSAREPAQIACSTAPKKVGAQRERRCQPTALQQNLDLASFGFDLVN